MNNITHTLSNDGLTLTSTGYTLKNKKMSMQTSWKTPDEVERNLEHAKVYNKIHIITQDGYSIKEIKKLEEAKNRSMVKGTHYISNRVSALDNNCFNSWSVLRTSLSKFLTKFLYIFAFKCY